MGKEILTFGDIGIEKKKFTVMKIFLKHVDIVKLLVCIKICYG